MRTTARTASAPYYPAQEMAHWCDVAVADYHYFYDSAAMLYALTVAYGWRVGVLGGRGPQPARPRPPHVHRRSCTRARWPMLARPPPAPCAKALDALQRQWNAIHRDQVDAYCAHPALPEALCRHCSAPLALWPRRRPMVPSAARRPGAGAGTWIALHFAAMAEQFGSHAPLDVTHPPRYGRRGYPARCASATWCPPCTWRRHAAAHSSVLFLARPRRPRFTATCWPAARYGLVDVESPFHSGQLAVQWWAPVHPLC